MGFRYPQNMAMAKLVTGACIAKYSESRKGHTKTIGEKEITVKDILKDLSPEQQRGLVKAAEKFRRGMQKIVDKGGIDSISISTVTDKGTKEIIKFEKDKE